MRVFESKYRRQVDLACFARIGLNGRAFSKVVGPQCEGVEVVGLIEDKHRQRIVLSRVSEGDAGWLDGVRKAEVQNQWRIRILLLSADINDPNAEDGIVLQHPPEETAGRTVVLAMED